jgi:hypothetical protein
MKKALAITLAALMFAATRSMETASRVAAAARWRILLPASMSVLAVLLMVLAKRQEPMIWKMGSGWEVPARVINSLINGPGFYLTAHVPLPIPGVLDSKINYDGGRLLGIIAFWFLIGLSIDRRGSNQAIDRQHPICAGVMFTSGALFCGLLGGGLAWVIILNHGLPRWVLWEILVEHPLRTSATVEIGLAVWLLFFSIYFAKRAFIAARR